MPYTNSSSLSLKIKAASVSCLLAIALTGCSSSSDNNSSAANNVASTDDMSTNDATQTAGSIQGTWDQCGSIRNTYVFGDGAWEQYLAYFDSDDCSGAPLSGDGLQPHDVPFTSGTYELLGEITTDSGVTARELNMTSTTFGAVEQFNIVFLDTPGEMVLGDSAGYSADDRPTALDFEKVYFRR